MLRLARIHPLVRVAGLTARSPVHISRVFSSNNVAPSAADKQNTLDTLLSDIKALGNNAKKEDKVPEISKEEEAAALEEEESALLEEEKELSAHAKRVEERFFPTRGTTAVAYDKLFEKYPALEYKVDTEKLEKRQQFEQVYFANHVHEPKKVIKFKNVVTKNYRTVTRSWPMVRLNSFKYGSDHFLDEMYDDIKGKYHWSNQLAYPDGSINLFCGTTAKASPLNVKGDPLAVSFNDKLYKSSVVAPIRLTLSKTEATARFPHLVADADSLVDEEPDAPLPTPAAPRPKPRLDETEAEQDEREAREEREEEEAFFQDRAARQEARKLDRAPRLWREEVPERESREQREARWAREKAELFNRPWIDMMKQKRAAVDERVLFDPVTMVKIVSYTAKGKIIERYYYKDQLTEDNVFVHPVNSVDSMHLEPGFDPKTGVTQAVPGDDSLAMKANSLPTPYEHDQVTFPNFPSTMEKNTKIAFDKLLPLREGLKEGQTQGVTISSSTPSSTAAVGSGFQAESLLTDLLDEKTLPADVRASMTAGFQKMVAEGKLKPQDETKYYNDYLQSLSKALARHKAEEIILNKIKAPGAELESFPGIVEVGPTYHFRYIKLNLAKGWIRFYVGEQDRSLGNDFATQIDEMIDNSRNPMNLPFVWKYSEYTLSNEDLEAMRSVKWPPSLVPPPDSIFQQGDGSPTDQLAKSILVDYNFDFEDSYLRFGNLIRFRQDLAGEEDLENTKAKYLRQVDPDATTYTHVPDPGPIDFSQFKDPSVVPSDPEARAKFDLGLRETIRREAKDKIAQAKKESYQDVITRHEAFQSKVDEFASVKVGTNFPGQLGISLEHLDVQTLNKQTSQKPLTQRFQQRGNTVVAFDASGQRVIQEYQGYRLKVSRNVVRIIRADQSAVVRFYDPQTGEKLREEDHSGDFYRPRTRVEYEEDIEAKDKWEEATNVGDAWEYVQLAHDQLVRVYNGEKVEELEEIVEDESVEGLLSAMKGFDPKAAEGKEGVNKELDQIKDELLKDLLKQEKKE